MRWPSRLLAFGLGVSALTLPACRGTWSECCEWWTTPKPKPLACSAGPQQPSGTPAEVIIDPPPSAASAKPNERVVDPPTVVNTEPDASTQATAAPKVMHDAPPHIDRSLVDNPQPPPLHPLLSALQAILEDRPDAAMPYLSGYDQRDQELIMRLLPIVARAERGGILANPANSEDRLVLMEVLRSLYMTVAPTAPLVIDKMFFCGKVIDFGRAEPHPTNQFRPGEQIRIYAEMLNLCDRRVNEYQYVSQLACVVEIRDADCKRLETKPTRTNPVITQTPRTDHYGVIIMDLPTGLEPGVYTLRVRIIDQDTSREDQKVLSFRIVPAKPKR
jgi:hypothetical protein